METEGGDDWHRQRSPKASTDFVIEVFYEERYGPECDIQPCYPQPRRQIIIKPPTANPVAIAPIFKNKNRKKLSTVNTIIYGGRADSKAVSRAKIP